MARRLLMLAAIAAVVAGACTGGGPGEAAPATNRSEGGGVVGLPLDESLDRFLDAPNATHAAILATDMGQTGDPRWVPYLVDILRMGWSDDSVASAAVALESITGVDRPDDEVDAYVEYGSWMYEHAPDPGATYLLWKEAVYALVDPSFVPLLGQVEDPVLASRLQWGGISRGGIPALDGPETVAAADADWMVPDEIIFGAVVGEQARAYPLRILGHHELANDTLGGRPVALAFCSLCRSAILFDREVAGRVLAFDTSGLLKDSNKVMVDRQTESLWQQLSGEALAGSLEGETLRRYTTTVTTWSEWRAEHPDTDILALPDPEIRSAEGFFTGSYSYEPGDAYREYFQSDDVWFPTLRPPPAFPIKAEVATIVVEGQALAVLVDALGDARAVVLEVGDSSVTAVATEGGARFYSGGREIPTDRGGQVRDPAALDPTEEGLRLPGGATLPRLPSGQSFWFAWYGQHADTDWWPR